MSNTETSRLNGERIIRKLGSGELTYDIELKHKGCILPFALTVESELDLFDDLSLLDRAIQSWKLMHPLLQSKIVTVPDGEHAISSLRYFAYADRGKIDGLDNVDYIRVETNESDPDYETYWKLLNEREYNLDPVDSSTDLLWRLKIVELRVDRDNKLNSYLFLFTTHHSIIDGRNGFAVLAQLAEIIEKMKLDRFDPERDLRTFQVDPSLEDKLFEGKEEEMKNVKINEDYTIPPNNKIPAGFSIDSSTKPEKVETGRQVKFIHLKSKQKDITLLDELLTERCNNSTDFLSFSVEEEKCKGLLANCKRSDAKLTGCMNLVASLATYLTYKKFNRDSNNNSDQDLTNSIYFHFMANMRQFLNIDPLNMGYWAIVLNGKIKIEDLNLEDEEFWKKGFWTLAKQESDAIHERIKQNELVENAKLDDLLVEDIRNDFPFQHGAVHFAISNLGPMKSESKAIRCKELYYDISCAPNRWTAIVFHGLSSINGRFCWGTTYNRRFIRPEIMQYQFDKIQEIIAKLSK